MIHNKNRTLEAIAGAERSGKTYSVERRANHYARLRGPVLVYNCGRVTDFADYEYIEVLFPEDVAWEKYPGKNQSYQRTRHTRRAGITHFKYLGKVYKFKDFNALFTRIGEPSLKLKMYRISDPGLEELFFDACLKYLSGCLIIMDDARFLTKSGVKAKLGSLLNKKNHGGQHSNWFRKEVHLIGIDIIMIYHSLGKISGEVFDYINCVTMFKTNQKPGKNIDNEDAIPIINKAYEYLMGVPRTVAEFTSIRVHLKGPKAISAEIIPPTIVNKIKQ